MNSKKKTLLVCIGALVGVCLAVVFRTFLIEWFQARWQNAIDWNINPFIFVGLLFATLYHYYKGWFEIAKGVVTRDKETLYHGIALNRFVWAIPYLYVLIFGRGYPWWVPAGIITWMVIGLVIFVKNYRKQDYIKKMTESPVGKLVSRFTKSKTEEETK